MKIKIIYQSSDISDNEFEDIVNKFLKTVNVIDSVQYILETPTSNSGVMIFYD